MTTPTESLAVFDPIKADIAKLAEENNLTQFDYEAPAGNKLARSHVYKLRQIKGRIAEAHKTAKEKALEVCQVLDAKKRELTGQVEAMIEVHDKPLREIEERAAKLAEEKATGRGARQAGG